MEILMTVRSPDFPPYDFTETSVKGYNRCMGSTFSIPQSISPVLNSSSPELISANELSQWADRTDSKTIFPELVRRLLAQTPGITNIEMRAHEGTAAPGWDGQAASTGSAYLPAGELRFELGTDKKVKAKADRDYAKRVEQFGNEAHQYIYVFATPRNWPGGQKWADERRKEQKFADVRVIDAHTLEGWLQVTPAVHYWISERLGRHPQNTETLSAWWERFQGGLDIDVPHHFFQAGRNEQVQKLLNQLQADGSETPVSIRSNCVEDVLAFMYAILIDQHELIDRTVIVAGDSAWSHLIENKTPLLLIPRFGAPDIASALSRGHRVLMIVDPATEYSRDDATISLPKIGRQEAAEVLREVGIDFRRAERLVALARRSMAAFLRSVSRNQVKQNPKWLDDTETAAILAQLVLIGAWEDGDVRDEDRIQAFIGEPIKDIRRRLVLLSQRADAPFIQSGSVWRLVDPVDAAQLLLPVLGREVIQRWEELIHDVLLAGDPYRGMNATEQLAAQLRGLRPGCSEILRDHVAQGLALVATSSDQLAPTVRGIVKRILGKAFADDSGETLANLAYAFPVLAEAAPDEFLTTVSSDLDKPEPVTRMLFQESERNIFGRSSLHPDLLWALELLCWSPEYYGRATMALAALADIAPDDNLSSRPIESLEKVTVGWIAQSAASIDDKAKIVKAIMSRYPNVGWELALLLLQPGHSSIFASAGPRYRNWELPSKTVTYGEIARYIGALTDMTIVAAGERLERWVSLIDAGNLIPSDARTKVFGQLVHKVRSDSWEYEDRHAIWKSLTRQIHHQRNYADTEWSMRDDEIAQMEEIANLLEDPSDPRQHAGLFSRDVDRVFEGLHRDDDGFEEKRDNARLTAIKKVAKMGTDSVRMLTEDVERPDLVGAYLAITDSLGDASVIAWLDDMSEKLQRAAKSYAQNRLEDSGFEWLESILETAGLTTAGKEKLIGVLPLSKAYWTRIDSLDKHLVDAYWSTTDCWTIPNEDQAEAVELLIQHGHPWRALDALSRMMHLRLLCEVDLVKKVLSSLTTAGANTNHNSSFDVSEALQWLESEAPYDPDLPVLEFQFFDFIDGHEPSDALYRALGNNPSDFVHLMKSAYRAENDTITAQHKEEREKAYAERAHSVLQSWARIPGLRDDGSIDAKHLTKWVDECRRLLAECGRTKVGDRAIGNVLSCCPDGRDGIWPAEEVRDLLEQLKIPDIESGLACGRSNQRGVSTRGAYDGGKQQRALAKQYRDNAKKLELYWPRTANLLQSLADDYESFAKNIDQRDEEWADRG